MMVTWLSTSSWPLWDIPYLGCEPMINYSDEYAPYCEVRFV